MGLMKPMQIDIEIDQVVIENQTIKRPAHTSRSEWLNFWDDFTAPEGEPELELCEACDRHLWIG